MKFKSGDQLQAVIAQRSLHTYDSHGVLERRRCRQHCGGPFGCQEGFVNVAVVVAWWCPEGTCLGSASAHFRTYTDIYTDTDKNVVIMHHIAPSSHSELNRGWRLCSSCSLRHRKCRKVAQALHDMLRISHDIFRHQLTAGRFFIDRVGAVWRQRRSDNSCTRHFERLFAHAEW